MNRINLGELVSDAMLGRFSDDRNRGLKRMIWGAKRRHDQPLAKSFTTILEAAVLCRDAWEQQETDDILDAEIDKLGELFRDGKAMSRTVEIWN